MQYIERSREFKVNDIRIIHMYVNMHVNLVSKFMPLDMKCPTAKPRGFYVCETISIINLAQIHSFVSYKHSY